MSIAHVLDTINWP